MTAGKTLRIIALEKFGSKEFWVYIYMKNRRRIENPNIVPVGTELFLPDADEFDIDASNPASIEKAKDLGRKELEGFE